MTYNFKRAYLAEHNEAADISFWRQSRVLIPEYKQPNAPDNWAPWAELISAAFDLGPDDKNVASNKATNNVR